MSFKLHLIRCNFPDISYLNETQKNSFQFLIKSVSSSFSLCFIPTILTFSTTFLAHAIFWFHTLVKSVEGMLNWCWQYTKIKMKIIQ